MFAVIFEAEPHPAQRARYLELAAELKPLLENIDGFIAVERFQSLSQPNRLLSLSWWRDEAALLAWRQRYEHRLAQEEGQRHIFRHYRLRVAAVLRDYGNTQEADRGA